MAVKKTTRAVAKAGKKITRREVIKKAAYVTPIILTLAAKPSIARAGSGLKVSKAGKYTKGKSSKGKYSSSKSSKSFEVGYSKTGKYSSGKGSGGRKVKIRYGQHSWGKRG